MGHLAELKDLHVPSNERLVKDENGSAEKGNIEFILPRLRPRADEISLCPSLGSKNQVLITVNQTLQIREKWGKAPDVGRTLSKRSQASSKACWCI